MEPIKISAKALGAYAMEDFCPRCAWIRLKVKKLPWQIWPGIFSSIDAYTKKVVHQWIDRAMGQWDFLEELNVTGYLQAPSWQKFNILIKEFGIILSGVVDDLWVTPEGIHIPDFKTARLTKNQDKLFPMYQAQLNGYAKIGKALNLDICGLSLIYMEPQTDETGVKEQTISVNFFNMGFEPHVIQIPVDTKSLDPLLAKAREIYDGHIPGVKGDCKDCQALNDIELLIINDIDADEHSDLS